MTQDGTPTAPEGTHWPRMGGRGWDPHGPEWVRGASWPGMGQGGTPSPRTGWGWDLHGPETGEGALVVQDGTPTAPAGTPWPRKGGRGWDPHGPEQVEHGLTAQDGTLMVSEGSPWPMMGERRRDPRGLGQEGWEWTPVALEGRTLGQGR